jgi:hypothetical protein
MLLGMSASNKFETPQPLDYDSNLLFWKHHPILLRRLSPWIIPSSCSRPMVDKIRTPTATSFRLPMLRKRATLQHNSLPSLPTILRILLLTSLLHRSVMGIDSRALESGCASIVIDVVDSTFSVLTLFPTWRERSGV